ncbi:hypothetical protein RHSIM_Rhsim01G0017200 [Rhododendron simsii]|uniref:Uncharacterized protein n=1 Tax=Rhododendron simsii TaxID=118357 RepID=A0A834HF66_RHOSS|nr:hypothetical protein RHSIM_Rhsim01G0017200 [Rhododendron simsii]
MKLFQETFRPGAGTRFLLGSQGWLQHVLATKKCHMAPRDWCLVAKVTNGSQLEFSATLPPLSNIDTPLPGHPVVVTTAPHSGHASINGIKVTEWDMYNDGCVIVHGVEDFFDPAFQTLLYRRYDNNNSSNKNGINKSGVDEAVSSSSRSTTPWQKDMTVDKLFIMLAVVSLAGSVLSLVLFCYWANRRYSEYSFICTEV